MKHKAQSTKHQKVKAMTLIEVLLYITLFGIIFITISQFALSVSEYNRSSLVQTKIQSSLIFVDSHIRNNVDDAVSVNAGESVFNNQNGKIVLIFNNKDVEYSLSNGRLVVIDNGVQNFLTPIEINVTRFEIEEIESDTGDTVGFRLKFTAIYNKNAVVSNSFESSYLL